MKSVITWFDRLEDRVRERLSRWPILYTIIGGVAIVLFWRGVWMTADLFSFLTGPVSILISVAVLLATGLFVSFFVGDVIILSGIKREKKLIDKTEEEVRKEASMLEKIHRDIDALRAEVKSLKERL